MKTSQKTIMYKYNKTTPTALSMAWKTSLIKRLPDNDKRHYIDGFIYQEMVKANGANLKKHSNGKLHEDGVLLDGYNYISSRERYYQKPTPPFFATDTDISEKIPVIKEYRGLKLTEAKDKIKKHPW